MKTNSFKQFISEFLNKKEGRVVGYRILFGGLCNGKLLVECEL